MLVCICLVHDDNVNFFIDYYCFITDKPIVSVAQKMYTVVEKSKLEIDCIVDSNPPPRIFWKPSM